MIDKPYQSGDSCKCDTGYLCQACWDIAADLEKGRLHSGLAMPKLTVDPMPLRNQILIANLRTVDDGYIKENVANSLASSDPPSFECNMPPPSVGEVTECEDGGEIRATDPNTGGAKGRKPERFALVPLEELATLTEAITMERSVSMSTHEEGLSGMLNVLAGWYRGDTDEATLLDAAGDALMTVCHDHRCDWYGALDMLARVYSHGADKYTVRDGSMVIKDGAHNFRNGYPWSWSLDAALRHLLAWARGIEFDNESGEPHLIHFTWHMITLAWFQRNRRGVDDRWRP